MSVPQKVASPTYMADMIMTRIQEIIQEKAPRDDPVKLNQEDYVVVLKQFNAVLNDKLGKVSGKAGLYRVYHTITGETIDCLEQFIKNLSSLFNFVDKTVIPYVESITSKKEWLELKDPLSRFHTIITRRTKNLKASWWKDNSSTEDNLDANVPVVKPKPEVIDITD